MSVKQDYDLLLGSGDLKLLFPSASGDWEQDKKQFTKIYDINQELLKQYDVEYTAFDKEGATDVV